MTDPQIEKLAKGLTKAQRDLLERLPGKVGRGRGMAGMSLSAKGLIEPCRRYAFHYVLTPLGLALRAHLMTERNGDAG